MPARLLLGIYKHFDHHNLRLQKAGLRADGFSGVIKGFLELT